MEFLDCSFIHFFCAFILFVETTNAKPNLQKWGKGYVRVYGTINGPNEESCVKLNLQANPEPFEEAIKVITSIFHVLF